MKLAGKDVSVEAILASVERRLGADGMGGGAGLDEQGVEPRVDPLSFNLEKLAEHADPTRGLEVESHRDGLGGRVVVAAKKAFRLFGQVLINEALARQGLFNGHVRDAYAQLSSEVMRLRARVAELEAERRPAPPAHPNPSLSPSLNPSADVSPAPSARRASRKR
jgi:hypothetical protein